jgi:hypothetical protein
LLSPAARWRAVEHIAAVFAIAVALGHVHPLQVSAVLYIVQRMETLSLTFVLLALLAYLHGRLRQHETGYGAGPG